MSDLHPGRRADGGARLHALDNLRAVMMWLGIVIHVAAIHMVHPPLPWRDTERSLAADLLGLFIHSFRMPVFFIVAGFFVAMLARQRGPGGMWRHRWRRIGLPFAVFWLPVGAATGVFAALFVHRMVRGTWGLDLQLVHRMRGVPAGPSTLHMWFLWLLLWYCAAAALVWRLAPGWPRVAAAAAGAGALLGGRWWGLVLLTLPLAWAGASYPYGVLQVSGSFAPPLAEWVHHAVFFVFGIVLYANRVAWLERFTRHAWRHAGLGLALFVAALWLMEPPGGRAPAPPFWSAFAYGGVAWLWSFALVGLALRYADAQHAALRYLAEGSYWVYLVHLPLTVAFGALLYGLPWPAALKMLLNVAATTLVCLASYHWLVRYTAIGVLLNGQRRQRPGAVLQPAAANS